MKMNLGSARQIRFLALVLALALVMGCMAVPTGLGEEEINTKYSIVVLGDTETCQLYVEYMLNSAQSDRIDNVTSYFDDDNAFPEGSTEVIYVVGEAGISLLYRQAADADMIFFFNAGWDTENNSVEEGASEWSSQLLDYLAQGTDLYVYLLSDGSRYAEITRAAVDNLVSMFLDSEIHESLIKLMQQLPTEARSDFNPIVDCQLIEIAENTFSLNDTSGNALGTLHVIDLDGVTIEYEKTFLGPWTYVCEDMMKRLGIVSE